MEELKPWSQLMKEYHTGKQTELKPIKCPFCGCEHTHKDWMGDGEYRRFWLICDECGAMGPEGKNLKLAIEAWNKRS